MYSNIPDQAEVLFCQCCLQLFQAACHGWINYFELEHDQDDAAVSCTQDARCGKWAIAKLSGNLENPLARLLRNTLAWIIVEHIAHRRSRDTTRSCDILTCYPSLLFFHRCLPP